MTRNTTRTGHDTQHDPKGHDMNLDHALTISELIDMLSEVHDRFGDLPIIAAIQPSYPLTKGIGNVCVETRRMNDDTVRNVAWLTIDDPSFSGGEVSPYAPSAVFSEERIVDGGEVEYDNDDCLDLMSAGDLPAAQRRRYNDAILAGATTHAEAMRAVGGVR